jgi:hypothetical protein
LLYLYRHVEFIAVIDKENMATKPVSKKSAPKDVPREAIPSKPVGRGGVRLNAGRPKLEDGVKVLINMTESDVAIAKSIGNGKVAEGVRTALRSYKIT